MLLILLPARPRAHPQALEPVSDATAVRAQAATSVAEVFFVHTSRDGSVLESGRTAPALLARRGGEGCLALLPEEALAWQRITVPRAPAARLPQALLGVVEEALLGEAEHSHLALSPGARAGQPAWLVATDRHWLGGQLAALQAAGLTVDRVAPLMAAPDPAEASDGPASEPREPTLADPADGRANQPASAQATRAAPGGPASALPSRLGEAGAALAPSHVHVQTGAEGADAELPTGGGASEDELVVSVAGAQGVVAFPVHGNLGRQLLPTPLPAGCRVTASPAAAAAAEVWLAGPRGHADLRIQLQSRIERMVEAAGSAWNLRQFELAAPHRGGTLLRAAWQAWWGPAWRPARIGLAGLVVVQLVGLNAWAWQQRNALAERRQAMVQLLRSTHPQVRAVLDAPLQMQRETEILRSNAGRAGDGDLETLMQALASAWPPGTPLQSLSFEAGRLTVASPDLRAAAAQTVAERLRPAGWDVSASEGTLSIAKGRAP